MSFHIGGLLDKMVSSDKDYRFMATNDLMAELQKDSIKLDDDSERKVVKMILKLLEDKNGEVQNLAVKCLGPLVNKVKEYHINTIVDTLCAYMLSNQEQLRDMGSLALKTVIKEIPTTSTVQVRNLCKNIVEKVSRAIAKSNVGVQLEALDITCDLLSRFGPIMVTYHSIIIESVLPQLVSPRMAVRKRSIVVLSVLSVSCNQASLTALLTPLVQSLTTAANTPEQWNAHASVVRTYIQCLAAIASSAGHRFGPSLVAVMPLLFAFVAVDDDELREHCLAAWGALVLRCPVEVAPHVHEIVKTCLTLVTYDPNYDYSEEEEDDELTCGEASDDDFSDDDDVSWKVRRAAAKCLEAVVSTRSELLLQFYQDVSPQLIGRFKEREETVKVDVFNAYIALLRASRGTRTQPDVIVALRAQVPSLVRATERQLKEKSMKTRTACFNLLTELLHTLPSALDAHIGDLLPLILAYLLDKQTSGNMKLTTLAFIQVMVSTHEAFVFQPHLAILVPALIQCATNDPFYKITAESLDVISLLVKKICPLNAGAQSCPYSVGIFECCLGRFKTIELDQEVKERSIICMSVVISRLGSDLTDRLPQCLPIFLDRLHNEITRLTTVRALSTIAASPLNISLNSMYGDAIPLLASFLRKNQRCLRLGSLQLLEQLISRDASNQSVSMLNEVLAQLPPLLVEADMHVSHSALMLLVSMLRLQPRCVQQMPPLVLERVLELVRSPLLQGDPLKTIQTLFEILVRSGVQGLGYQELTGHLLQSLQQMKGNVPLVARQSYPSVAACVATLTLSGGDRGQAVTVVRKFLSDLTNQQTLPHLQAFSLLAVGEIGKRLDLAPLQELLSPIMSALSSNSEEVKSAGAVALGHVACGNLNHFLPLILNEIANKNKKQYLLLHCIKEILNVQASSQDGVHVLDNYVGVIWEQLYGHVECNEEGTRNVVSECLGKITNIKPAKFLPELQASLQSPSANMRVSVITALKYTISDQPSAMDAYLQPTIGNFLEHISDPDLNVRKVSLLLMNCVAHNKPALVKDLLTKTLPDLYDQTRIRKELIREVEMGPFKHPVDDGLDIRKAAFECMYTFLDTCLDQLDIWLFLDKIEDGLKDHYDIKMLTYLMLTRLVTLSPQAVMQKLDKLVEVLRGTVYSKVKAHSVKQEYEKQDELKRAALRCLVALTTLPDADKNIQMTEFLDYCKATEELAPLLESVTKDSSAANDNRMDLS